MSEHRLTRSLPAEPMHEPLAHRTQFARPKGGISRMPTRNHANNGPTQ